MDMALTSDGTEGWAVGGAGNTSHSVLHLSGGTWTFYPPVGSFADTLGSVSLEAAGEAWAGGCAAGYHYQGAQWQRKQLPTSWCGEYFVRFPDGTSALNFDTKLSLVPGRGGWGVGLYGEIFRYNPLAPGQRFYDVPLDNPFYTYIEYMASHNIISGYSDNTFRPNTTATRGQLCKIVVLAENWTIYTPPTPTFRDVPTTDTFYPFVETAYSHNVISGYTCGPSCLEFRPGNNATRGQIAKIIYIAVTPSPR
jgi:hypothetical protein